MSHVIIRIPMPLRTFTAGIDQVAVDAANVHDALARLGDAHDGILSRVIGPDAALRPFVNVFVGSTNVRSLQGLATPLADGDVVSIVPAVAGGAQASQRRLAELKHAVTEVDPQQALGLQARGAALIDVREADEIAQGRPVGALPLGRGYLELRIEAAVPDTARPLVVLCNSGARSLFAAESLIRMGYCNVVSLAGGFAAWKAQGLPIEVPQTLDAGARQRYSRHLMMPEVGEAGQLRLNRAKVLMIGAGGLGSPAAFYLAAAGVGTLGIVDHDVVDRSNLQRQILHADSRVGTSKVSSARQTLEALNPAVKIVGYETLLTSANIDDIVRGYDLIVDGSDNFPTRYLVNDACVQHALPNVHGSVFRFDGQATVFWPRYPKRRGPCYRCLYPEPPPAEFAPSCADAGVLGVLPGVIGLLQANEAIKLLLGIGDPLVGRLLVFDGLRASFTELALEPDPGCRYCGDGARSFPGYIDYERFCASAHA